MIAMPRPANRHATVFSALLTLVNSAFEQGLGGPGGWWIVGEPELHFGKDVLVPDIAGWRIERMPEVPEEPYFTLAPDWGCEVLSPSTENLDRTRKRDIFAREGIGHVWLVDPAARTLEVYRWREGEWVQRGLYSGEERVQAEPFEAWVLELGRLWPRKREAR